MKKKKLLIFFKKDQKFSSGAKLIGYPNKGAVLFGLTRPKSTCFVVLASDG